MRIRTTQLVLATLLAFAATSAAAQRLVTTTELLGQHPLPEIETVDPLSDINRTLIVAEPSRADVEAVVAEVRNVGGYVTLVVGERVVIASVPATARQQIGRHPSARLMAVSPVDLHGPSIASLKLTASQTHGINYFNALKSGALAAQIARGRKIRGAPLVNDVIIPLVAHERIQSRWMGTHHTPFDGRLFLNPPDHDQRWLPAECIRAPVDRVRSRELRSCDRRHLLQCRLCRLLGIQPAACT